MTSFLMLRHRRIIVIAFLLAAVATLFLPEASQAAAILAEDDPTEGSWTSPSESQFADDYLPVFRWSDASADMHTRVGGGDQMDNIRAMSKSKVAGSFIIAGNFFFTLVTGLTKIAIEFTPLDSAGKSVDEAFATLGDAIIDSPILGIIIVICLVAGLTVAVRQTHGKPIVKTLAKPLILIAIFSVMVSGATASTDSKPGSFSPWWVGNTVNDIVTEVATLPTESLQKTDLGFKLELNSEAGGPDDPLACEAYLSNLKDEYKEGSGDDSKMSRSIAVSLSNMWEATALDSYIDVQFGRQSIEGETENIYGDRVFCRMLDQRSSKSADDQVALMDDVEIQDTDQARKSGAFAKYGVDETDVSMMYWAACRFEDGAFTVDDNWAKASGGKAKELGDGSSKYSCSKWWDNPPNSINPNSESEAQGTDGPLNFAGDRGEVNEKLDGTPVSIHNFVYATQGWEATDASINAIVYMFSSLCIAFAFGVLALIIFGSKIGMIVMLLLLGIAIIADAIPTSGGGKIKKYAMSYLGMAFLAFGVQLIYAVVVFLTSVIAGAGEDFIGTGMMRNVWLGLSAVISFILLHLFITKWMKAPSPFTPSGAGALMAGAAGGKLLTSGLGALGNMRNKSKGGNGGGGTGVGGGSGKSSAVDTDGQKNTGTTDKMDPSLGDAGASGGATSGTSDGANPVGGEEGAPAVVGAGGSAGGGDGQAVGGNADGAPAIGAESDGEDGKPEVTAGAGGGSAAGVEGENADGAPAIAADEEGQGASGLGAQGAAGAAGGAIAGAGAGAGGGSGAQALDGAGKKREGKHQRKAQALDQKVKDNKDRHMVMANNGAGPDASLGQKIGHKAKVLGSSAKNLGANSALRARAGVERQGGVMATGAKGAGHGAKGVGQGAKQGAKGLGHAARWTARNSGKAGKIAAVAGGAAIAAPVILPAGAAAAAVMTVGGAVGGAAALKGGFNVGKAGVKGTARGAGAGYKGAKSAVAKGGSSGYQKIQQVAKDRWPNRQSGTGESVFGTRKRRRH